MSFYDEVLREIIAALGAALFLGNLVALLRRRSDRRLSAQRTEIRTRPGSPVRGKVRGATASTRAELPQAPMPRTIAYLVLGFVVMVWAIASLAAG